MQGKVEILQQKHYIQVKLLYNILIYELCIHVACYKPRAAPINWLETKIGQTGLMWAVAQGGKFLGDPMIYLFFPHICVFFKCTL